MPTHEDWLEDEIVQTVWTHPLTSDDLLHCFLGLAEKIDKARQSIHVLFEITDSGSMPIDAPVLAIRSRFMVKSNTGRIAVVGTNILSKMLADVAARVTKKEIRFFSDRETALKYLRDEDN
jgi:hypothetical protein